MGTNNQRNLFFGLEACAPWPESSLQGRMIPEESRHLTLAFLGKLDPKPLLEQLPSLPVPEPLLGGAGVCDRLLFLPERRPRVVSYHVRWLSGEAELLSFRDALCRWLLSLDYRLDERPLLSHVTVARAPFDEGKWKKEFHQLPLIAKAVHLYQSRGELTYLPLWSLPLSPAFEELSHTGEAAFAVRGKDLNELYLHAQLACSFLYPPFLDYLLPPLENESFEEMIIRLNESLSRLDEEIGSPVKALSFHGELQRDEKGLLFWEMILDI